MNEKIQNLEDLMKRLDEFENTVTTLLENIKKFKAKLLENKSKYGPDVTKWPNK